ncbi:response regulator [Terrimonas sp. NA20]|uniref:Response regulator n=1 Tax=Terrimonas ginsenosidimutans TaxID=2908004 RepID=A0ABS9L0B8_9BACT|nr:response regulator [Terrimonas ginsenosidimutans]MCG2618016.1 response regulator [Terrimonas ginsenosidimutans]
MKQIILVEDDPAITDTLRLFIQAMGFELTAYRDGNAILSGLKTLPDLFLLDKQLPGIDGLDICRFLKSKKETQNIPVVIMSASPSVIPLSKLAGADEVIIKPYELIEMRELLFKFIQ